MLKVIIKFIKINKFDNIVFVYTMGDVNGCWWPLVYGIMKFSLNKWNKK